MLVAVLPNTLQTDGLERLTDWVKEGQPLPSGRGSAAGLRHPSRSLSQQMPPSPFQQGQPQRVPTDTKPLMDAPRDRMADGPHRLGQVQPPSDLQQPSRGGGLPGRGKRLRGDVQPGRAGVLRLAGGRDPLRRRRPGGGRGQRGRNRVHPAAAHGYRLGDDHVVPAGPAVRLRHATGDEPAPRAGRGQPRCGGPGSPPTTERTRSTRS